MAMYYWICPNCEISIYEDHLYCSCGYSTTKDEIDKIKIPLQEVLKIIEKRKEREKKDVKGTGAKINYRLLAKCTSCSQYISKRANACPKCGSTQTKACSICQSQIPTDSSSCPECGDPAPFGEYQTSLIDNTDSHDTTNPEEDIKKKECPRENNTMKANYYSISSVSDSKSFWGKLLTGDFGLAKTYWVFGVLVNVAIYILINLIDASIELLTVMLLAFIPYSIVVIIGTWRSSDRYSGSKIWAILAKIAVVLGIISLGINFLAVLALINKT